MQTVSNPRNQEFQELLLQHLNSFYNLAYRFTLNRETAQDLVQDAAVRAYRFFYQFKSGTNFKSWFMTILRNTFINDYRKRVKQPIKIDYNDVEEIIGSFDSLTGAEQEIFGEAVQRAIDRLPEQMRTIITLFYVEGLSYKEIASVMDCPIGTVMSRLHMSKKMLKKHIIDIRKNESYVYE